MWHEGDFCEANTGKIGGRIEEALLHLGQIEQPGYGTFRYVTPVRMQAGLFKQTGEYLRTIHRLLPGPTCFSHFSVPRHRKG